MSAWEVVKRLKDATLWRGQDAEGRKVYDVTANRDGIAVEPSGCSGYSSQKAALESREPSGRGRPKVKPDGSPKGNPQLQIRLSPTLHAWCKAKGNDHVAQILEREARAEGAQL